MPMVYRITCAFLLHLILIPARSAPADPIVEVIHSPKQPHSGEAVRITLRYQGPLKGAVVQYQIVEPGKYVALSDPEYASHWESLTLTDTGEADPKGADVHTLVAELPG